MKNFTRTLRTLIASSIILTAAATAATTTAMADHDGSFGHGGEIAVQIDHNHQPLDPQNSDDDNFVTIDNSHQPEGLSLGEEIAVQIDHNHQPENLSYGGELEVQIDHSH